MFEVRSTVYLFYCRPEDVTLTPIEIVLLSSGGLCVSLYSYSHQLIRKMIPRRESNPIGYPAALILDKSLNILIADSTRHLVCVFSFDGALLHRFGSKGEKRGEFKYPTGIAIDDEGRIIVVSQNREHCLQVFSLDRYTHGFKFLSIIIIHSFMTLLCNFRFLYFSDNFISPSPHW